MVRVHAAASTPGPKRVPLGAITHVLLVFALCSVCFYGGLLTGVQAGAAYAQQRCESKIQRELSTGNADCERRQNAECERRLSEKVESKTVQERSKGEAECQRKISEKVESMLRQRAKEESTQKVKGGQDDVPPPRFGTSVNDYAVGMARTSKDSFTKKYDVGVPMSLSAETKDTDVTILYNHIKSVPTKKELADAVRSAGPLPLIDVEEATANCDALNIILTQHRGTRQCTAIVGSYESYHIQRWLRIPPSGSGKIDSSHDLKYASRGYTKDGFDKFRPPSKTNVWKHWTMLRSYLNNIDGILESLGPIAKKVAIDNTIFVLTCNVGQSELLMNFACSARARGFSLQNVLVFPTDVETKDLAEGLGLSTFYDANIFADMPKEEAGSYADSTFAKMMIAKILSVQLTNLLGYDVLFQDVDIVWYKNPLAFFHDESMPFHDFDVYFQDDGSRQERFAPYSPNSGFYYVRYNDRTRYLFTSLLYAGDIVLQWRSHQSVLNALLAEHSSLYGLRVKVFEKNTEEFPGGSQYHGKGKKDFMKRITRGETNAHIFHMSWTHNKENKVLFFQQMGDWYLDEKCVSKKSSEILAGSKAAKGPALVEPCCLAEPLIKCHYRDKPSKIPCTDSPSLDKNGQSFW